MDFTKIDFTKIDPTKLFDVDAALSSAESANKKAIDLIPDWRTKNLVETVSRASFEFVRAQTAAAREFGEAVKKAIQI